MRRTPSAILLTVLFAAAAARLLAQQSARPEVAEQLLAEANRSRAQNDAAPLQWDESLARAALRHSVTMAAESEIGHRFPGEASVEDRTSAAGAHFSLIEENVGVSSRSDLVHPGWMNSPEHRKNLLNPAVDRVGIGVVFEHGYYYATADYARAVPVLSREQVEDAVAALIRAQGIAVSSGRGPAREACRTERGMPSGIGAGQSAFVMRWQDSDLSRLPDALVGKIRSRAYRRAEVGSCPPQGAGGAFTSYRLAVLLLSGGEQPSTPGLSQPYD